MTLDGASLIESNTTQKPSFIALYKKLGWNFKGFPSFSEGSTIF